MVGLGSGASQGSALATQSAKLPSTLPVSQWLLVRIAFEASADIVLSLKPYLHQKCLRW